MLVFRGVVQKNNQNMAGRSPLNSDGHVLLRSETVGHVTHHRGPVGPGWENNTWSENTQNSKGQFLRGPKTQCQNFPGTKPLLPSRSLT